MRLVQHTSFFGNKLCILLVKQILVSSATWIFFTLDLLDLLVPGFNKVLQWLQLSQAGIPWGIVSMEKANYWIGCWPQFQKLLAFMAKKQVMWDHYCLLVLVLNLNGSLDGDHGWKMLGMAGAPLA